MPFKISSSPSSFHDMKVSKLVTRDMKGHSEQIRTKTKKVYISSMKFSSYSVKLTNCAVLLVLTHGDHRGSHIWELTLKALLEIFFFF